MSATSMVEAVRAGRVEVHRSINGPGAGPHGDFYAHRDTIDGRTLTGAERNELHRLCADLVVWAPRLPNGPGSGRYEMWLA